MSPWPFAFAMALPLAGLWVAERRGATTLKLVCKPLASLCFVLCGALLLPWPAPPAQLLLLGLVLSLVGDVLLIPKGSKRAFLLGLGSFLLAHVAYALAFVARGVDGETVLVACALLGVACVPLARWLFSHVRGRMRPPVAGYVVAITAMVALAVGAVGDGARVTLAIGAVLFYLSDLCVARERFVVRSLWNGAVGLPLYYAAQLLLVDGMRS